MSFNNMVKVARATYLANFMSMNLRNPKFLFDNIYTIVTPASSVVPKFFQVRIVPNFFLSLF